MSAKVYEIHNSFIHDAPGQSGITRMVREQEYLSILQQNQALQLSHDNIINSLGIKGDGPVSKLVIEYVMGLVAENVALKEATDGHYYWEYGGDGTEEPESFASNGEMKVGEEFELVTGVEIGYTRFRVLNDEHDIEILSAPLQTPVTDAAISEIKSQGIEDWISSRDGRWNGTTKEAEQFAANMRAGRKG